MKIAPGQLAPRRFGVVFSVGAQQLQVGLVVHSPNSGRRRPSRTGKGGNHFAGAHFGSDTPPKVLHQARFTDDYREATVLVPKL